MSTDWLVFWRVLTTVVPTGSDGGRSRGFCVLAALHGCAASLPAEINYNMSAFIVATV